MIDMDLPSLSTIGLVLRIRKLTHRRTGRYIPKGKQYPELPALLPTQTLRVTRSVPVTLPAPLGSTLFMPVDTAINRCGIEPFPSKAAQSVLDAVYQSGYVWGPREPSGRQ